MKQIAYIHGLNCSPEIFSYLYVSLPKHNTIFISYDSFEPIETSYQQILAQLPKKQTAIVGHSLGGLLGHLIATRNNGIQVSELATISTPFGGSLTAKTLYHILPRLRVLSDLSPTSKVIREAKSSLAQNHLSIITTAGGLPYVFEHNDGVVSIRSQECAPTPNKIKVDANHFDVVYKPDTVSTLTRHLFA